mgnify:CR=1 FL=1
MHALIFDVDGTLTETNDLDARCFAQAVETLLGVPDIETDWDTYPHVTDSGIISEVLLQLKGRPGTIEETREFEAHFLSILQEQPRDEFPALPGAGGFLGLLRRHGLPVAIATGAWRSSARHKLSQAGIDIAGIPLSTASEGVSRIEIMLGAHDALLAHCGVETFERVTYFGDAAWDVRATGELGWELVGIGARIDRLRELSVQHTFSDYRQQESILERLGLALE